MIRGHCVSFTWRHFYTRSLFVESQSNLWKDLGCPFSLAALARRLRRHATTAALKDYVTFSNKQAYATNCSSRRHVLRFVLKCCTYERCCLLRATSPSWEYFLFYQKNTKILISSVFFRTFRHFCYLFQFKKPKLSSQKALISGE